MFRRLDDRIRELCAKVLKGQDPAERHNILSQLGRDAGAHRKAEALSRQSSSTTGEAGRLTAVK
jgi:hypothetical protein